MEHIINYGPNHFYTVTYSIQTNELRFSNGTIIDEELSKYMRRYPVISYIILENIFLHKDGNVKYFANLKVDPRVDKCLFDY